MASHRRLRRHTLLAASVGFFVALLGVAGPATLAAADDPPPGAPPSSPLQLWIGDPTKDGIQVVVDGTITVGSGSGWTLEELRFPWLPDAPGIYQLFIDGPIPAISAEGVGALSLVPTDDDAVIGADAGYSINADGELLILTGLLDPSDPASPDTLHLDGGISTAGWVSVDDLARLTIGSASAPAGHGVRAVGLEVGATDVVVHASLFALKGHESDPDGMKVVSRRGHTLTAVSHGDQEGCATDGVASIRVLNGGAVNLTHGECLGTFTPQAAYWLWNDDLDAETGNPEPTVVSPAVTGSHPEHEYTLTSDDAGHFLLQSTAAPMWGLNWHPSDDPHEDPGGTVRAIAGRGFRFLQDSPMGEWREWQIQAGTEVVIELLPDQGFQFVSGGINSDAEMVTTAQDEVARYRFTMPNRHVNIEAVFEKSPDVVAVTTDALQGGTITVPDGAISNGNAELTVAEGTPTNIAAFTAQSGGRTVAEYLDLDLNQVILPGSEDRANAWVTPVTELAEPMTVNLRLASSLRGYTDYVVLREHGGTVTTLPTTYDAATGTLTFATDAFSTYAIAHGAAARLPVTGADARATVLAALSALAVGGVLEALRARRAGVLPGSGHPVG